LNAGAREVELRELEDVPQDDDIDIDVDLTDLVID
jgi:hypothetical protein